MLNGITMTVTKYNYAGIQAEGTAQANYFESQIVPNQVVYAYLHSHLIKESLTDIEYTKEVQVREDLQIQVSNIRFQVSNLLVMPGGKKLVDFFEVYSNKSTYKWHLLVEKDNKIYFEGMIYKSNIAMEERHKEIISITAIGLEKEFKEYYSNKQLPELSWYGFYPAPYDELTFPGFVFRSLYSVLDKVIGNRYYRLSIDASIAEYKVIKEGYTYADNLPKWNNGTVHLKCGYQQFVRDKFSCFRYFNDLCLSMGWVWYFYNRELVVRERCQNSGAIGYIDFTAVSKHKIETTEDQNGSIHSVIIDDGGYYSDGLLTPNISLLTKQSTKGSRKRIVSESVKIDNRTKAFRRLLVSGNTYVVNYSNLHTTIHTQTDAVANIESQRTARFTTIRLQGTGQTYYQASYDYKSLSFAGILEINPAINSVEQCCGIDITLRNANSGSFYGAGNYLKPSHDAGNNGFWYNGNPANNLFYYNAESGKFEGYEEYCQTNRFRNNFRPLLSSGVNIKITLELHGLISDPTKMYILNSYPYHKIAGRKMIVSSLSLDLINEKTKISLLLLDTAGAIATTEE